ncbi:DUF4331 domain-containing protein [Segetibacter sp. 3557_3]|uniref:DUF4331 family protein n=1 Tax=Segetibacter sp. 3557_3 TaxID=2547429 RepID=UPI001058A518|nr:DUF4331 family protein [Segetibacter sp. 3557_3]TDH28886.1 DUF4331 domain-containing protein [Segetibacter sp. 3557_3]
MKKILNLFAATLVCVLFNQTTSIASSHREAPLIAYDPLADNTDVYAFRSPCDTNNVVIIANYIPFEAPHGGPNYYDFSPSVRYQIHIKNNASTTGDDIVYRFTFRQVNQDPNTWFYIRGRNQNMKTEYEVDRSLNGRPFERIVINGRVPANNVGPRSLYDPAVGFGFAPGSYETYRESLAIRAVTNENIFCGPSDDPFFVDLGGAFDLGNFRKTGRDGLAKMNTHSIVMEIPIKQLQKDGKETLNATSILDSDFIIGVYATASRQMITTFDSTTGKETHSGNWVQVSRLGMPLTNEVVNPIGVKDLWNATMTNSAGEAQFDQYLKNPELALYMDDSKFGTAVPGLADLRIQSKSLGSFDFRNGMPGLYTLKGSAALTGTALAEEAFGAYLLPDNASPRAVDLLPIFKTGVPNLRPYQLATGKPANNPLAAGKPFINNFLPTFGDMLRLNMAVPVTPRMVNGAPNPEFSSLGLIQAAVLGLTDNRFAGTSLQFIPNMDGFPNGRRLEDDVTTIELQAVGGVVLAAIGLWYDDYPGTGSPVTPQLGRTLAFNAGVTKNDTTIRSCFPFVQTPWVGFTGPQYMGPKSQQGRVAESMLTFNADKSGEKVLLRWSAMNENNGDRYEVERKTAQGFVRIGSQKMVGGKSTHSYELFDATPSTEVSNIYRVKLVAKDGSYNYSPLRMINFSAKSMLTIAPNPATDYFNVYTKEQGINISLLDNSGKRMASKVITSGSAQFDISRFAKGMYMIVAERNGVRVETIKVVKH